jgi:hypothetical protein
MAATQPASSRKPERSGDIRDPVAAAEMPLLDPGSQSLRSIGRDDAEGDAAGKCLNFTP